jgi:hypothetical protein
MSLLRTMNHGELKLNRLTIVAIAASICGNSAAGEYLGRIGGNPFCSDCTANPFAPIANPFNANSLTNQFGSYGNRFSPYSPSNRFATRTPKVYSDTPDAADDFAGDDE